MVALYVYGQVVRNLHLYMLHAQIHHQSLLGAYIIHEYHIYQGPDFQSIVNLTSSLVFKMLTVLVSEISNSQLFLLKNVSSFCKCKNYSHFFSKNISIYAISNDQSFNNMLTNDIVSFEQQGPEILGHLNSLQLHFTACSCV